MEENETPPVYCRKCGRGKLREEFSPPLSKGEGWSDEAIEWAWQHHPPRECKDCVNQYNWARRASARTRAAVNVYWEDVDEPPLRMWRANKADHGWSTWKPGRPKPRGPLTLIAERAEIREQGRAVLTAAAAHRNADDWPAHTIWGAAQILGPRAVSECTGLRLNRVKSLREAHTDDCRICGPRNPDAPHRVYLFHFARLEAFKVGVTHVANDSRLTAHRRAGGELRQIREVPNWRAALDLEQQILAYTARRRLNYGAAEFPHGGGSECWADDLIVDLDVFHVRLTGGSASRSASGPGPLGR